MQIPLGLGTPLGAARLVQLLYIEHYPFPYRLSYQFQYKKRILHVEWVPLKRSYYKFIPLVILLGTIVLCTMSLYYLAGKEVDLLQDIRFWAWVGSIIVCIVSIVGNLIVLLDTDEIGVKLWERMVDFDWHIRKGMLVCTGMKKIW